MEARLTCPCEDQSCDDVRAHDVTAVLAVEIDVTRMLSGLFPGGADVV